MKENIRSQFPITQNFTYLNSAAVSPMPLDAGDAVSRQIKDVTDFGSLHFSEWVATKERCRELLAGMLCVQNEQIAFTRNTSDGFASIAAGSDWSLGGNIVSFAHEFPSNYYPWRSVRDKHDIELRLAGEVDGRVDIESLISMIDADTRVVSISSVQFASGYRSDLERIGKAARAVDALFCVDLIQGLGGHGYDLPAQYVDAASGAGHKWLCAPEGCGYLYLSERARERITPELIGWISVEEPWNFTDREQSFKPNALAWESGTGPSSLFYGLEESLKLITSAGLDNIEKHLDDLTATLCEGLEPLPYEIVSSRIKGEASAIVCVKHTGGMHCNEIASRLEAEKVIVSPRDGRLRIAPHFYNNADDIQNFLSVLRDVS